MSTEKTEYWTLIDSFESSANGGIYTHEHALPGGKLIMTEHRWQSRLAATVIFVSTEEKEAK